MEFKEIKSSKRKAKRDFSKSIHFFCLYQKLGHIGKRKFGGVPPGGWNNCPFIFDEIGEALWFFGIYDDEMEEAIDYCIKSDFLEKRGGCFYITADGLANYINACKTNR